MCLSEWYNWGGNSYLLRESKVKKKRERSYMWQKGYSLDANAEFQLLISGSLCCSADRVSVY